MGSDARIDVVPEAWMRVLRRLAVAVLAVAVIAAAAVGVAALTRDGAADAPPAQAVATTAIWLSGSSLSYADAQEAARLLGWQAQAYSLPGVGISRGVRDPDASLLAAARRLLPVQERSPDVVVLQGGEADNTAAAQPLSEAATSLIDHVRASTDPGTRVVLVGPIPGSTVPDSLRRVNEVLATVAQQTGVEYVDAVSAGWRAGDPAVAGQLADALG